MEVQFTCPNCGEDRVHLDGIFYVCSVCAHEFAGLEASESYNQENIYEKAYHSLSKLERPFFKLKPGTLYTCWAEEEDDAYDITFMPLACDINSNRFFALFHAQDIFSKNAEFLKEVLQMSFKEIKKEVDSLRAISNFPFDPILCSTDKDGTLLCEIGILFKAIKETV